MTDIEIQKAVEEHISAISSLLGIPVTMSNKDTPKRVAKMYCSELFKNINGRNYYEDLIYKMATFPAPKDAGMVTVSGIKFWSVCEHHWMPFGGVCSVSYIPNETIIGLSKIPRVVKYYSKMPQLQENLTRDIGEFLCKVLEPKMLHVEIEATHTCVMCRGAESECSTKTVFDYEDKIT